MSKETNKTAALIAAAKDFVAKVERGEAHGTKSYLLFKKVLTMPDQVGLRVTYSETDGFWLHIDTPTRKAGIQIHMPPVGTIAYNALMEAAYISLMEAARERKSFPL